MMASEHSSCSVDTSDSDDLIIDVVGDGPPLSPASKDTEKKKYYCQRCLNHNIYAERKGHKNYCRYLKCVCDDCILIENRKELNRALTKETGVKRRTNGDRDRSEEEHSAKTKGREPRCAKCRIHNNGRVPPLLKGHKGSCAYKNCSCHKCELVTSRRNVMAKQIRLRRKQKMTKGKSQLVVSNSQTPAVHQRDEENRSSLWSTEEHILPRTMSSPTTKALKADEQDQELADFMPEDSQSDRVDCVPDGLWKGQRRQALLHNHLRSDHVFRISGSPVGFSVQCDWDVAKSTLRHQVGRVSPCTPFVDCAIDQNSTRPQILFNGFVEWIKAVAAQDILAMQQTATSPAACDQQMGTRSSMRSPHTAMLGDR